MAAKGGNSDNAHACQQGGHENRFEAETGNPFNNAGDCASHGAKGGVTTFLVIDTSSPNNPYPCNESMSGCWGVISAAGLFPNIGWGVFAGREEIRSGFADAVGAVGPDPGVPLNLPCHQGFPDVIVISSTSQGAPLTTGASSPCG